LDEIEAVATLSAARTLPVTSPVNVPRKPLAEATGPENEVRLMVFPYIQVSLLVGISSTSGLISSLISRFSPVSLILLFFIICASFLGKIRLGGKVW
jgi:hypothetical protein